MGQMFWGGAWSSVCGATPGAVSVACKIMGFSGASATSSIAQAKENNDEPLVGALSCSGSEASLSECSFDHGALNVFCAPREAVWARCSGNGDASGWSSTVALP